MSDITGTPISLHEIANNCDRITVHKFMVADECVICGSKRLFVCYQVGITDNWRTVETRPLKHAHDYEHTQAPRTNQPAL